MTIDESREALTNKIYETLWDHAADKEISAFEKAVREDERAAERLRMHRLLRYAIEHARGINPGCITGLRVADCLVVP
jgi:hypothetical protein